MRNKDKKQRILDHIAKSLEAKTAGKVGIDEANHLLLIEIRDLLQKLVSNQAEQPATESPAKQVQTAVAVKKSSWKFWLKN